MIDSKRRSATLAAAVFFLSAVLAPAQSQEIPSQIKAEIGRFSVTIVPATGSFEVRSTVDGRAQVLLASSPSYGSVFRLAGDQELYTVRTHASTVRVQQSSSSIALVYQFPGLGTASLWIQANTADSLFLSAQLANTSTQEVRTQLILDTVLGESSGTHFLRSDQALSREFSFSSADSDASGLTLFSGQTGSTGLLLETVRPDGGEYPIRTSGANIRRLVESPGSFVVNANRNFNLLPFSVNDSALMYSRIVPANGSGSVHVYLKLGNQQEAAALASEAPALPQVGGTLYALSGTAVGTQTGTSEPTSTEAGTRQELNAEQRQLLQDLSKVDEVLARIDEFLGAGEVSDEEFEYLRGLLEAVSRRPNQ